MLELPLSVLVLLEQVAVVELVQNGPELGLGVAAELAEVTHAERVELAVALLDDGDSLLAGHHAVADVAGRVVGGGGVASRSVRMAGDMFDQAIIAFIKRKYNLLIGERTAEQIKIEIGSAYVLDPELTMEIKGRNLVDGLPKNIVVHSEDVRAALLECLEKITSAIKETLERTPPELSADIIDRGITLTGGGALLRGLDQLIQSETGIDVHVAEDPLDCVAKGAGAVLDHVDVLHDVLDTDGGHM